MVTGLDELRERPASEDLKSVGESCNAAEEVCYLRSSRGIAAFVECVDCEEEWLARVSLLSECREKKKDEKRVRLEIERAGRDVRFLFYGSEDWFAVGYNRDCLHVHRRGRTLLRNVPLAEE